MDYGNNAGGAEFNWNYSMGGNGGGASGASGAGMNVYPQVSLQTHDKSLLLPYNRQMGQMDTGYGGGQQWLHSNQANTHNYQSSMPQGQTSPGPFDDYNQSMMRYTNLPKTDG